MSGSVTELRKIENACTNPNWKGVQAVMDVVATAPVPFAGLPAVIGSVEEGTTTDYFCDFYEYIKDFDVDS